MKNIKWQVICKIMYTKKQQEYLKNLSYDSKQGCIKFYDPIKEFGYIFCDDYENDIYFKFYDVFNKENIQENYNVEFITDVSNDRLSAEQIIIKNRREVQSIYAKIIDNRFDIWKALDDKGMIYDISEEYIKNKEQYYENCLISLKIIDGAIAEGQIVFKGYVDWLYPDKNGGAIISLNNQVESKFKLFNLINANTIKEKNIVYYAIDKKEFASDIFVTKEKYNG